MLGKPRHCGPLGQSADQEAQKGECGAELALSFPIFGVCIPGQRRINREITGQQKGKSFIPESG